jgi:D-sedoheptulose 7-phosphate isomerase
MGDFVNVDEIKEYMNEGAELRKKINHLQIYELGIELSKRFRDGHKLLIFGNGGSAADSQHIATEFVSKFRKDRKALPALALNTNTSSLTAISNDYDFGRVFERQVEAFASNGDVVIGISTSGNSENIVRGLKKAREMGCLAVGFTGKGGGRVKDAADITINVDSTETSLIQEVHIAIGHIISKIVEDSL